MKKECFVNKNSRRLVQYAQFARKDGACKHLVTVEKMLLTKNIFYQRRVIFLTFFV